MVGMTPWGVFFLACKLPYTKCWLLCQQAHRDQKWGKVEGQHFSGCCLSAFPHILVPWGCLWYNILVKVDSSISQ